jgi:hypothetical protein
MGAVVVAAATALSFVALSAMAQSAGDYTQVCRGINGRLACSSVARSSIGSGSTRPYEQWEDGSPARVRQPGICLAPSIPTSSRNRSALAATSADSADNHEVPADFPARPEV